MGKEEFLEIQAKIDEKRKALALLKYKVKQLPAKKAKKVREELKTSRKEISALRKELEKTSLKNLQSSIRKTEAEFHSRERERKKLAAKVRRDSINEFLDDRVVRIS